jgi:DNA (cytosine-5)-methyltransferase 1
MIPSKPLKTHPAKNRTAPRKSQQQRVNSFFAGIGGFDLAFERAGFTTTFLCENNRFCQAVLRRHWPTSRLAGDIRELAAKDIPRAQIWTAGFPCQDLSLARTPHGRQGFKGQNSSLFFTFCELAANHKPEVIVIENVAGLLNSHKGLDFHILLRSLNDLGYAVAWRVLNARYFGVPQSRPRIFICASRKGPEFSARVLFEDDASPPTGCERDGFLAEHQCQVTGAYVPALSFCISATSGRHTGLDWARSYVTYDHGVRRLTPKECERLQGFPDDWTIPAPEHPIPIKGIDTDRYQAVGNAVCVPVAHWLACRLRDSLRSRSGSVRGTTTERLVRCCKQFEAANVIPSDLGQTVKWLSSGCAYRGCVVQSKLSPAPAKPTHSLMVSVLENTTIADRYFLSPNAAQGIVRRVDKMGRKLFGPMDRVLRKLANRADRTKPVKLPAKTAKSS